MAEKKYIDVEKLKSFIFNLSMGYIAGTIWTLGFLTLPGGDDK